MGKLRKTYFSFFMVLLVLTLSSVDLAMASTYNGVTIDSPVEGATVSTGNVTVKFSAANPFYGNTGQYDSVDVSWYLDGTLYVYGEPKLDFGFNVSTAYGELNLTDLPQGQHQLEIRVKVNFQSAFFGPTQVDYTPVTLNFTVTNQPTAKPKQTPAPFVTSTPDPTTDPTQTSHATPQIPEYPAVLPFIFVLLLVSAAVLGAKTKGRRLTSQLSL